MSRINPKLEQILSATIELYTHLKQPISSAHLIEEKEIKFSSAKIRYLMKELEDLDYLKKAHSSSGRIPTPVGLSYYAKHIAQANEKLLEKKLKKSFDSKKEKANFTIAQAAETIADITGLTLITTKFDKSLILKSIDLVPISSFMATAVMVVSNGEVHSKMISLEDDKVQMNELKIAVRVFKEELIGVALEDLVEKTYALKEVLKKEVSNYLAVIAEFVNNIFNIKTKNNVYGRKELILSRNFTREQVNQIIDLVENYSIWEKIENKLDEQENLKIAVNEVSAFLTKRINTEIGTTEISIVGPQDSDFNEMKTALSVFEKLLIKGENNE
ncbi:MULTISPECIES: heat-inducible transcriptional repressor HrcA [unclassified Mycoplasma]|uniref:heat-inducible transcriptional repressor HrcA n=1 Tax=unclassified Mycoplasma TaxID=2683645 RepID=UPI00211CCA99|nr:MULTISPECIES: heat-inducible transcriptional repressor HrcA [unclassified Mycoplasma]UUM19722.1 heat-inducible transcriptional repressor HrcA [Mycoplasma sp. 1578d]UUM24705.1 heat-inducible transcriptional repressor HrcA [Mycoplasma sp. 3686d]